MESVEQMEITTPPLTRERFEAYLKEFVAPRPPQPKPTETVDFTVLLRYGIGFHMERSDLVLFSADGMRRAREVGAIRKIP